MNRSIISKKSLGLLNVAKEDNNEIIAEGIINICKKGWRYAYTFVEQNNNIKLSIFLDRFVRKNKGLENISDDELNSNILVILFLSQQLEKSIDETDELYIETIKNYILRIQHYEKVNRINIDNLSKEKLKELRELELKIKNEDKIGFTPSDYLVDKEYEELKILLDSLSSDDKYFSAFEYIFDFEEISLVSIVGNDYFNSKEIQELIFCYTQFFNRKDNNSNEIDFNELKKYLYPAIQIRYLSREYKKAKDYFFKNFNEELYQEIAKIENDNREVKKLNLLLQDDNEKLKLQIEELERENKRLNQQLSETDNNKNELKALREFIFNLDTEIPIADNRVNYSVLNDYKGVVIGGHNSWQNKLKEVLSKWIFIGVDAINFDENILKNSDCIFINVGYLSHAMYYRIMSIINSSNKKTHFINKQNIELCIEEIYSQITK